MTIFQFKFRNKSFLFTFTFWYYSVIRHAYLQPVGQAFRLCAAYSEQAGLFAKEMYFEKTN